MICLITISETGWLREAHIGQVTLCVVADFFILPPYRGNGLRKALFSSIMNCSQFRVRRLMINTMGSEKYGDAFEPVTDAKTPIGQPRDQNRQLSSRDRLGTPCQASRLGWVTERHVGVCK